MNSELRCSNFARAVDLQPAGSAGSYDGFFLVEQPLPWAPDVKDMDVLGPLCATLTSAGARYRVQALFRPRDAAGPGTVVHYRRAPGPFHQFVRSERLIAADDLVQACVRLAERDDALSEAEGLDLVVCTHGSRDTCCGSLGTMLFVHLPAFSRGDVRTWRTSHTGGHRFAPTAILFPSGTMWAYLDASSLAGVIDRTMPPADAANHYRGCAGLDGGEVQALDGAAFAAVGWEWLDTPRTGRVIARDDANRSARVRLEHAGGAWEATIAARPMPVPDCGQAIEMAKKLEPEYAVSELAFSPLSAPAEQASALPFA